MIQHLVLDLYDFNNYRFIKNMRKFKYLITGGTGSFGKTVTNALLLKEDVSEIRIFSRDETKQDLMRTRYMHDPRVKFYIGDIRDYNSIHAALSGVDFVFHAAALKLFCKILIINKTPIF